MTVQCQSRVAAAIGLNDRDCIILTAGDDYQHAREAEGRADVEFAAWISLPTQRQIVLQEMVESPREEVVLQQYRQPEGTKAMAF